MSMKHKIEFEIGETKFKQRVVLVKETDDSYTLIKHAASQRDDTAYVPHLTRDMIRNMLKAIDQTLNQ